MYSNINTIDQLRARVEELEKQQLVGWLTIKDTVQDQYERLKPANLIRNAIDGFSEKLNIKPDGDILREGAALVSGVLVNVALPGSKNKKLKKTLTIAVFSIAMYFITQHREEILNAGNKVVDFVTDKINTFKARQAARKARKEAEREGDDDEEFDFPEE